MSEIFFNTRREFFLMLYFRGGWFKLPYTASVRNNFGKNYLNGNTAGFNSLRILVAGERCNFTGEYFERGPYLS